MNTACDEEDLLTAKRTVSFSTYMCVLAFMILQAENCIPRLYVVVACCVRKHNAG